MRIRNALLAVAATVAAGSAIAAPAMAQDYRHGYERNFERGFIVPAYGYGYAPAYGYGYPAPYYAPRFEWGYGHHWDHRGYGYRPYGR